MSDLSFEATSRFLETANGRLHYHEAGSGPALLLLHGSGPGVSGWANFQGNLPLFSRHFRTIILATRSVTRLAVEYQDVYRKQDGRWWIEESVSRITSILTEEIGEDGTPRYVAWGEIPAAQ